MCGIVACLQHSNRNAQRIAVEGLKKLEYRGYDSTGVATVSENGDIIVQKKAGRISELERFLTGVDSKIAVAHTRWSTHGEPTDKNAHPHTDCDDNIALVHNGIIENFQELRKQLEERGHVFSSDTDTEVIAHLMEDNLNQDSNIDAETAFAETLKQLDGSYALAVLVKGERKIFSAKKNSPLIIGVGKDEFFLTSDVSAILDRAKNVIYLDDGEIAILGDELKIFDSNGSQINKEIKTIEWDAEDADKQGFEHFMLKEIYEHPKGVENTIKNLGEIPNLSCDKIYLVSCGTASYACLTAKYWLEKYTNMSVEFDCSSEFRYRNPVIDDNTLFITVSQSGETADTLAAMREAKKKGAKTLAIVNVVGSTIAREADYVLYTRAGPEIGVASTKAYTTQLAALYMLVMHMARPENMDANLQELEKIPGKISQVLRFNIKALAEKYADAKNFLFIGRNLNLSTALEGALKFKEITYAHAEGIGAGEMKHGHLALIDENFPTIAIVPKDSVYEKMVSNIQEIMARKGRVIAVSDVDVTATDIIKIPETIEDLYPLLTVVPLQLFAYYVAVKNNRDVDKPRNLAKSVTVE
jgi:glucosamine--fructose-6-phosphate aminotransferase (isomerizing)